MLMAKRKGFSALLGLAYLMIAVAFPASASVHYVWAVNDGEKIERDDLNNPSKAKNSAWDGGRIKIFGARNEIIAFQLIIGAGEDGINSLSVTLPELRQQGGVARIRYAPPALDPTNYVSRPIEIFSVNYMKVEVPSHAEWIYLPGSPAAPADPTGWKPVQLVPENARAGRGGFPLRVEPNQNQAIWIEVYLNRNLPAGIYNGEVEISADGKNQGIPVELELFDFTLPDENSMHAMIYYESLQPRMYQGRDLDTEYDRFAHRQRVELVHEYNIETVTAAAPRFNGDAFTNKNSYEGPGEGVGNR